MLLKTLRKTRSKQAPITAGSVVSCQVHIHTHAHTHIHTYIYIKQVTNGIGLRRFVVLKCGTIQAAGDTAKRYVLLCKHEDLAVNQWLGFIPFSSVKNTSDLDMTVLELSEGDAAHVQEYISNNDKPLARPRPLSRIFKKIDQILERITPPKADTPKGKRKKTTKPVADDETDPIDLDDSHVDLDSDTPVTVGGMKLTDETNALQKKIDRLSSRLKKAEKANQKNTGNNKSSLSSDLDYFKELMLQLNPSVNVANESNTQITSELKELKDLVIRRHEPVDPSTTIASLNEEREKRLVAQKEIDLKAAFEEKMTKQLRKYEQKLEENNKKVVSALQEQVQHYRRSESMKLLMDTLNMYDWVTK